MDPLSASRTELQRALDSGQRVESGSLAGHRYRGVSLGLPPWIERLSWKTFEKAFHRRGHRVVGWNVRLEQTGLDGPVVPLMRRGAPLCFGFFEAVDAPDGLWLDYGRGGNPALDPTALVRDPLVALPDGRLLGRSLVQLGPWRVGTPSYFVLERIGAVEHVPERVRAGG
ncbi:MAG: hypothetical protein VX899_22705 [Myxococcota bacterium]|nr:hypothetical protein [Myxococcota bacterium]